MALLTKGFSYAQYSRLSIKKAVIRLDFTTNRIHSNHVVYMNDSSKKEKLLFLSVLFMEGIAIEIKGQSAFSGSIEIYEISRVVSVFFYFSHEGIVMPVF